MPRTKTAELYILPSFFSYFYSGGDTTKIDEISNHYRNGNFDQYTDIKQVTNENVSSKFKEIRYIPLSNSTLDYESDAWDFSPYTMVNTTHKILHFDDVCDEFKDTLKDFILLVILKGNIKLSSIYSELVQLRPFFNLLKKRGVVSLGDVDESDVKAYFESLNISSRTFLKYQASVKKILMYYDSEYGTSVLSSGIEKLCERMEFRRLKAEIKNNKRSAIPDEYFDKLVQILIKMMNDPEESDVNRSYAAMLLIDSQTGLRASELSLLEADSVETIKIDDIDYRMIHYKVIKTAKGNTGYTEHITYVNDLAFLAYEFLMKHLATYRKERKSDLLLCLKHNALPTNPDRYREHLERLCIEHLTELDGLNSKYKNVLEGETTLESLFKKYKYGVDKKAQLLKAVNNDEKAVIYQPIVHQFRNTVVDRLLRAGIQLEFIRRYMGHLSQEMTDGYADYKDTDIQESINFSEQTLRTYLTGDSRILGSSGNALMERIDEWIKEQDLNVANDLDEIVDKLLKVVPIRSKHGGMCIKGAKLTDACSVDAMTDEFYCACGICPNVCHFYFNADVSFSDLKASIEIYEFNKTNGFNRQAEKEKKKIQFLIANRLNPELNELDRVLKTRTKESVMAQHPNMAHIIENLDEIKTEVKQWS